MLISAPSAVFFFSLLICVICGFQVVPFLLTSFITFLIIIEMACKRLDLTVGRNIGVVFAMLPFFVGERVEFALNYGPVSGGTGVMEVRDIKNIDGADCFHLFSAAKTNWFFSLFFKIDDTWESYCTTDSMYTIRYEKRLREKLCNVDVSVDFDHKREMVFYSDGDSIEMTKGAMDFLTSIYYVRTLELSVGDTIFVNNHTDKENYPLEIYVLKKERVNTFAGIFDCLKCELLSKGGGIFGSKGGLTIWVTDDSKKLPVLLDSKVAIGSIRAIARKIKR